MLKFILLLVSFITFSFSEPPLPSPCYCASGYYKTEVAYNLDTTDGNGYTACRDNGSTSSITYYYGEAYTASDGSSKYYGYSLYISCNPSPTCTAPQVLSDDGSTCIDPPITCDEGMIPDENGTCVCDAGYVPNQTGGCALPPDCSLDDPNSVYDPSTFQCVCDDNSSRSPFTDLCVPVCGQNSDDIDCDAIPNESDPDIDGDGIPNESDPDIDGDGIPNESDSLPIGGAGNGDSIDCGSDFWSDEYQACIPNSDCPLTELGCIYDIQTNISSRPVIDCAGFSVTVKKTWGDCDTETVTCKASEYSCHGVCIDQNDVCGMPKDDSPDPCIINDINSHSSGGTCLCNVGFHFDDGTQSCKKDDNIEHDSTCDYPSVYGGYDFQHTTFTVSTCQHWINYYLGGVYYKLPGCDYIGCYYSKDFEDTNGTNPNSDTPEDSNPDTPTDVNGTVGDGNGDGVGDGNSDGGSEISDFGLFDNLRSQVSNTKGQNVDLRVDGGSGSVITVSLSGKTYVLYDPAMIPPTAWDVISSALKWIAIISGILTVFTTI